MTAWHWPQVHLVLCVVSAHTVHDRACAAAAAVPPHWDTDIDIHCVLLLCSSVVPRGRAGLGPDCDPLAEGVEACLHDGGEWWARHSSWRTAAAVCSCVSEQAAGGWSV